jgi:hypothetical protein
MPKLCKIVLFFENFMSLWHFDIKNTSHYVSYYVVVFLSFDYPMYSFKPLQKK